MKKMEKLAILFLVLFISSCLLFVSASFGQEAMPKPGDVIDKSNYKKYQHLFPQEFLPYFENGYNGLTEPWVIKVSESKPRPVPKIYLDLSESQ